MNITVWPFLKMTSVRPPPPDLMRQNVLRSTSEHSSSQCLNSSQSPIRRAGCAPSEAVMIGDRLSSDIRPARLLGSKTIRVAQGFAGFQSPRDSCGEPDLTWNDPAEGAPAE